MKLPENISGVLGRLLEDLKSRESILGIGLFGSWSRGDAVPSSDIDLLIVDSRDFGYEYVERAEVNNCFFDLDYIPEKWIIQRVPPEIDQKLFEAQVLFDRNLTLTKAKDLMSKTHWKPERVEIRTENYVMGSDAYLSRAQSAQRKEDFQSAVVYAVLGFETILKVLMEVNKMPISNSRFIAALEYSCKKLDMYKIYEDYVGILKFSRLDRVKTEKMLNSFSAMWREAVSFISANLSTQKALHIRVRNNLNYYGKESFMKGLLARTRQLIEDGLFIEATHYMLNTTVEMLENYMWLASAVDGTKFDYTILFQQLKNSKSSPMGIYQKATEVLGIEKVSVQEADETIKK
ncbi:MAG: nucleotidyltransferase domain-containing protein, partial [Candidatus Bathyarchaeia archaeon]